jgi:hypothetical protein
VAGPVLAQATQIANLAVLASGTTLVAAALAYALVPRELVTAAG